MHCAHDMEEDPNIKWSPNSHLFADPGLLIIISHLRPALMNLIKTWSRTVFRLDLSFMSCYIKYII